MLLDSMKVVSFCHVQQGPASTQYLGDPGAQVTKIEPLDGERSRRGPGADIGCPSALNICAFCNERLFAVDLKSTEGREIARKLVDRCDVLIENFRHGVMEAIGCSRRASRTSPTTRSRSTRARRCCRPTRWSAAVFPNGAASRRPPRAMALRGPATGRATCSSRVSGALGLGFDEDAVGRYALDKELPWNVIR